MSIFHCQLSIKFQFISVLTKSDNLLPPGCQRKKGAKKPRQSSPRFRLRPAAILKSERLLQNGAETKGSHPHLFIAPYSVSWQQPHKQSSEISFLVRRADDTIISIITLLRNVNTEYKNCAKTRKEKKILDNPTILCYHIAVAKDSRYASCSKSRRGALIEIFCVSFCLLAGRHFSFRR